MLAGLLAAVASGADLVECDVGEGLHLGHPGDPPTSPLPLAEALEGLAPHPIGLLIDLKRPGIERDVVGAVRERGLEGRVVVSSTSVAVLEGIARDGPELVRAIGYPRDPAGASRLPWPAPVERAGAAALRAVIPLRAPRLVARSAAAALSLHHALVSADLVALMHRRGAALVVWTVRDRDRIIAVASLGVDAIVSDDPGMALAVLGTLTPR